MRTGIHYVEVFVNGESLSCFAPSVLVFANDAANGSDQGFLEKLEEWVESQVSDPDWDTFSYELRG